MLSTPSAMKIGGQRILEGDRIYNLTKRAGRLEVGDAGAVSADSSIASYPLSPWPASTIPGTPIASSIGLPPGVDWGDSSSELHEMRRPCTPPENRDHPGLQALPHDSVSGVDSNDCAEPEISPLDSVSNLNTEESNHDEVELSPSDSASVTAANEWDILSRDGVSSPNASTVQSSGPGARCGGGLDAMVMALQEPLADMKTKSSAITQERLAGSSHSGKARRRSNDPTAPRPSYSKAPTSTVTGSTSNVGTFQTARSSKTETIASSGSTPRMPGGWPRKEMSKGGRRVTPPPSSSAEEKKSEPKPSHSTDSRTKTQKTVQRPHLPSTLDALHKQVYDCYGLEIPDPAPSLVRCPGEGNIRAWRTEYDNVIADLPKSGRKKKLRMAAELNAAAAVLETLSQTMRRKAESLKVMQDREDRKEFEAWLARRRPLR